MGNLHSNEECYTFYIKQELGHPNKSFFFLSFFNEGEVMLEINYIFSPNLPSGFGHSMETVSMRQR